MNNNCIVLGVCYGGEWRINEGKYEYTSEQRKMIKFRSGLNLEGLKDRIASRLHIDRTYCDVKISVMAPGGEMDKIPFKIEDDEDLEGFWEMAKGNKKKLLPMYIIEEPYTVEGGIGINRSGSGSNQQSDTMQVRTSAVDIDPVVIPDLEPHPEDPSNVEGVGYQRGYEDVSAEPEEYQGPTNVETERPVGTTKFPTIGVLGGDEPSDGSSTDEHEDQPQATNDDQQPQNIESQYYNEYVQRHNSPVTVTAPNTSEPVQGVQFENTQDSFHWIPPPLANPEVVITDGPSRGATRLRVMEIFKDKETLQAALGRNALEEGYQYKVTKSDKNRWETKCVHPMCKWRTRATRIKETSCFQLRRIDNEHTCPRDQINPNHRQAGKKILGELLKESFRRVDRIYRGKEIQTDMASRYRIDVSYSQAWRAKNWALNELRGSPEESFNLLPIYCHNLSLRNPGTVTHIETDSDNRFQSFFMSLGCSIRTFKNFIRPVICIDGAHLKGRYLGIMFLAVCMDGNNQIFPLAFGVGASETADMWTWFLSKMSECIGDVEDLAIISDRAPSIDQAVRLVFPEADHGSCCHHLRMNVRAKYRKSKNTEGLYWKAAKAYRISDFNEFMGQLQCLHPSAACYLTQAGFHKWARSHFSGRRYNIMTTNSAESFNALTRYARKLPITMLAEYVRQTLQLWFYERRRKAGIVSSIFWICLHLIYMNIHVSFGFVACTGEWDQLLTPWATAKVAKHVEKSTTWQVNPVTDYIYEVQDGMKDGLVDLQLRTCTCRKFQLSQLPCSHAAAVARYLRLSDCSLWAHTYYTTETLRGTYSEAVFPLGSQSDWIQPDQPLIVFPPIMQKRRAGRPRGVSRIPSRGEEPQPQFCSRCNTTGHTRLNCKSPIPMPRPSRSRSSSTGQPRRANMQSGSSSNM